MTRLAHSTEEARQFNANDRCERLLTVRVFSSVSFATLCPFFCEGDVSDQSDSACLGQTKRGRFPVMEMDMLLQTCCSRTTNQSQ